AVFRFAALSNALTHDTFLKTLQGGGFMRRVVLTLSLAACLSLPAAAQTTDGGFGEIASPSVAAVAKGMHATIRRDLAEAAAGMAAEAYGFNRPPAARRW